MMRVLLVVLAVLLAAPPAHAQFPRPSQVTSYARSDGLDDWFRAFTTYSDGVTTFRYFARITSGDLFLGSIGLVVSSPRDDTWAAQGGQVFFTHGAVGVFGEPYFPADTNYGTYDDGIQVLYLDTFPLNFALYGCDLPDDPNYTAPWYSSVNYLQTCPEQGLDGWVEARFHAYGRYTLNNAETIFHGYPDMDVTVTPEPLSLALLGTGLAGVGLVRRRKREQRGE